MKYHSPREYLEEARSPATTAERLDILAETPWEFVRAAVAANPNVSARTLLGLVPTGARPADEPIALALAQRRDATAETLRSLAKRFGRTNDWSGRNLNFALGLALLANPATPPDVVALLLDPKRTTPHFRSRVLSETQRVDVINALCQDASEKVSKRARMKLEQMERPQGEQ